MRSVGVAEALGESVDENARVRIDDIDFGVGPVGVIDWEEDVSNSRL